MDPDALRGMVANAASGDEVAFARIVAAYHDDMARVSFVVCGDVQMAQDAVQAAWPKVWGKLGTIRDPARIRPWLVSVAANEAKQLARSRNRRWVREVAIDGDASRAAPGSMSASAVSARAVPSAAVARSSADPGERAGELDLANALADLNADDRILIALRYAAGLTSDEIGRAIGMTGGGVRARLTRLLKRLREELDDD
jgi:RNA polymerase sigma factor (sigma-70 family)